MAFNIIVAVDTKNGIGKNNKLAWKNKYDMLHFKKSTLETTDETKKNVVIMGRKTYESIPNKYRPLHGRINIVLSKTKKQGDYGEEVLIYSSLNETLDEYYENNKKKIEMMWIIGGFEIYKEGLNHDMCRDVYITKIEGDYECDIYFPELDKRMFRLNKEIDLNEEGLKCEVYRKVNIEEKKYLDLLKRVLEEGIEKGDRTGVGTYSIFSGYLRFDISERVPLLTSKRIFFKGIFEELMWILRGETDSKILGNKGVHIWDGNSTREFLDKRGLFHYEAGDIGPTYGFSVRNYGGKYKGCNKEYGGFDQLEYVVELLKKNKESRRILINLWDPTVIDEVALTPCMMVYNFYVDTVKKKLNLQMYLRSSDILLGLPWNIGYASLLVYLMCNVNGIDLEPGELVIVTCDQHLYKNHIEQAKKNLSREPYGFPRLKVLKKVENITDFEYSDLKLTQYKCYPGIRAPMAV